VIGLGNRWRRDDAAGLAVARQLRPVAPAGVEVLEREGEPASLINAWDGAAAVWLVDALEPGASPGAVRRFDAAAAPLPVARFATSTHILGLADALELARALGRLPAYAVVYGIEAASSEAGGGLSPPVAEAVSTVVEALRHDIAERLGAHSS
jgi:hydrogenase maturation protease